MAIYLYVTGTTLIVSLLAMATMAVMRIERRQASALDDRVIARSNARSAVELALRVISDNSAWRTDYDHGVESTRLSVGTAKQGTISWVITDDDGDLVNGDINLRLKGIGRVGGAVQASSVQIQASASGPDVLRSWTTSNSSDDLRSDRWWCQYFKPILPSDANGWWITRVDFWARRDNSRTFRVRLYRPNAISAPSGALVGEAIVDSGGLSTLWGWKSITFDNPKVLDAGEGMCVTLETTAGSPPLDIAYSSSGVSEANTALIRGNPSWYSYETNRALQYRVYGYYTTSSGVQPVAGTWIWDAP
jgi:hypothetical protein